MTQGQESGERIDIAAIVDEAQWATCARQYDIGRDPDLTPEAKAQKIEQLSDAFLMLTIIRVDPDMCRRVQARLAAHRASIAHLKKRLPTAPPTSTGGDHV